MTHKALETKEDLEHSIQCKKKSQSSVWMRKMKMQMLLENRDTLEETVNFTTHFSSGTIQVQR